MFFLYSWVWCLGFLGCIFDSVLHFRLLEMIIVNFDQVFIASNNGLLVISNIHKKNFYNNNKTLKYVLQTCFANTAFLPLVLGFMCVILTICDRE